MRVLIVGGGGREHALAWALGRGPGVRTLFAVPGNPGIGALARCLAGDAGSPAEVVALARKERVDLVVVGPEAPLVAGVVDALAEAGIRAFGPTRAAAAIEGSKAFAKDLMARHGIPTARFEVFETPEPALRYLRRVGAPVVVKADGLAAGKGAIVCPDLAAAEAAVQQVLVERAFGAAGDRVVIEEFLEGQEVSAFCVTDGETVVPLPAAQDHKRVFDGDRGPNTGGMGAYSPAPCYPPELAAAVEDQVLARTVRALAAEGRPFRGVLYAGLMLTREGPRVLEFNCRPGDPEAQVILPRLASDFLELVEATLAGRLAEVAVRWRPDACVCVVLASGGYPGSYRTGLPISGVEEASRLPDVLVFHAGTAWQEPVRGPAGGAPGGNTGAGRLVTAGGRVLGVTALGPDLSAAVGRAYAAVGRISFDGMHYRRDVAHRALQGPRP